MEIASYEPEHLDAVARFRQSMFGSAISSNRAYIIWKYHENPFLGPALSLAMSNGELIGMRGLFGAQWELGSEGLRFDAPAMADTAIHPAHREGGSVFLELGHHTVDMLRRRHLSWYTNLSATAANYVASRMHLGMRSIGTASVMRRGRAGAEASNRVRRLVRSASGASRFVANTRAAWAVLARTAAPLRQMRLVASGPGSSIHVSNRPEIADMSALAEETGSDHIQHVTNESYLHWRFRNPLSTYAFVYTGDGSMDGYLVIQRHLGHRIAHIVDMRFASDDALQRLLEALNEGNRWPNIETWLPPASHELEHGLIASGLRKVETTRRTRRAFLLGRVPSGEEQSDWSLGGRPIDDPVRWDVRMLASDAY
jgi:hypothetical protein